MICIARSTMTVPEMLMNALRARPLLLIVFAALQLGDVISTHLALKTGLSEGNPIPAAVLAIAGEGGMYALKLLAVALFLIIICRLQGRFKTDPWRAVTATNVIMAGVVLSNTAQLV